MEKISKMEKIRDLIEKYDNCRSMSEKEMKSLYKFYQTLCPLVNQFGKEFGLMKKELRYRQERIALFAGIVGR